MNGLGCDTLSVDMVRRKIFAVHHLALGAGLYHLENLADLSDVPEAEPSDRGADQAGRRLGWTSASVCVDRRAAIK